MTDPVKAYGWTAVPRKVETLLASRTNVHIPLPVRVDDMDLPDTPLAKAIHEFATKELAPATFNHSMRVYYYGIAIALYSFPTWLSASFNETYLLTCLLHDIGTTDKNMSSTRMSFEFHGGHTALDVLSTAGAPKPQAESVAEAVIRHQDLGETGTLTTNTALLQLATIFDNVTPAPLEVLVSRATVEDVVARFPRLRWTACFAATIRKEMALKPWCHTTHLGEEDFANAVLANKVMAAYEE